MQPVLTLALLAALPAATGHAQKILIPASASPTVDADSSSAYPWARGHGPLHMLTIYDRSNFAAINEPILITRARYRAQAAPTTTTWAGGTYSTVRIHMGNAFADYTYPRPYWTENYWPPYQRPAASHSGPVHIPAGHGNGAGVAGPWLCTIDFAHPGYYDPSAGNDFILEHQFEAGFSGQSYGLDRDTTALASGFADYSFSDTSQTIERETPGGIVCELTYRPIGGRLCTVLGGATSLNATADGAGNMFDLDVLEPTGITVTHIEGVYAPTANTTVEVWLADGTYVGKEHTPAAWTRVAVGSATTPPASNVYTPGGVNITDFCLPPGTHGVLVWVTASTGSIWYYSGANLASTPALAMSPGNAMGSKFAGTINSPRTWSGCIYYELGQRAGVFDPLGAGCPNSSSQVASLTLQGGALPRIASALTFEIAGAPPSAPLASILLGFSTVVPPNLGIDLGPFGAPAGCVLYPNAVATLPLMIDAAGTGQFPLTINSNPFQLGLRFHVQGVFADPGSTATLPIVTGDAKTAVIGCP